ncbi:MAG: NAD(P)/FAD-dependent oxidoreductase [Burkholderiales bacterium]|nr:NAD(P)/FAD-dependent oxidoreductase [Burkholderiales bacterium]
MNGYDVAVIGAGAAGMMCAATAGKRGARVVLVEHAAQLAEKIRISGGGRCNFTNLGAGPACFVSANPGFCRSALARYTPQDFLRLVARYRIAWHEKHRGQLFCDGSSEAIIAMLRAECDAGGVAWRMPCAVESVARNARGFTLATTAGPIECARLVVATGGLSIPRIGATDFGYRIARQFGLAIVDPRPALVPLVFDPADWAPFARLAGVSLPAEVSTGDGRRRVSFAEDLLFTHRGLTGPAILQISTYWEPGEAIAIDLAPGVRLAEALVAAKRASVQRVANALARWLPKRLAEGWVESQTPELAQRRIADVPDKALRSLGASLNAWRLVPAGTEGFRKAEVTRGGVDTRELSSTTMEARRVPGLYFVGEVVDVTGWLGGYNFQWAWASGHAAGEASAAARTDAQP